MDDVSSLGYATYDRSNLEQLEDRLDVATLRKLYDYLREYKETHPDVSGFWVDPKISADSLRQWIENGFKHSYVQIRRGPLNVPQVHRYTLDIYDATPEPIAAVTESPDWEGMKGKHV